jgi:hypothetical protein
MIKKTLTERAPTIARIKINRRDKYINIKKKYVDEHEIELKEMGLYMLILYYFFNIFFLNKSFLNLKFTYSHASTAC